MNSIPSTNKLVYDRIFIAVVFRISRILFECSPKAFIMKENKEFKLKLGDIIELDGCPDDKFYIIKIDNNTATFESIGLKDIPFKKQFLMTGSIIGNAYGTDFITDRFN